MEKQQYLDDLKDIREIMHRSSRFISLSGFSGVAAGIFALIGAWLAYQTVYMQDTYMGLGRSAMTTDVILRLLLIAFGTIVLSFVSGIFFTTRKAKKNGQKLWDVQTKRLLVNLFIPLLTGGLLCITLLFKGFVGFVAPLTLIFYGLALVNASKYTFTEIRGLGILEIILGLTAFHFIGYGLFFWAAGFGVLHIVYGIIMQVKYD